LKNKFVLAALMILLTGLARAATEKEVKFPHQRMKLGSQTLNIEMALSEDQRERGLMFRQSLGDGAGMLFVYSHPTELSFWMKNTFIPLSIGFFNDKKELIDIQDMEPVRSEMQQDIPSYHSRGPAQYALEVNKGWFQKYKIGLHTKFTISK